MKEGRAQTASLLVSGLCCAEEAQQIEKALLDLPGVKEVRANPISKRVAVAWEEPVHLPDIEQAVRKAGFQVRPSPESLEPSSASLPNLLGAIFVGIVAILILVGIIGERFGLIEAFVQRVPPWLAVGAVLIGGYPIFKKVVPALRMRRVTSHALMTLGIIGALSIGEFASAAVIVFFMRMADALESFTAVKARQAIRELTRQTPETAWVERDGTEREVPVEEVKPGEVVRIKSGGRIPVDGKVIEGLATVNQAAVTGESIPVQKTVGDEVFAAALVERGYLRVKAGRVGRDSTFGQIIHLVEEAESSRAPVQRYADRFTAYYIPVVVLLAAITYLIRQDPVSTVAVLVVACSCAFAMATPVAVLAGMGRAARQGVIIKGGLYLERLAKINVVVLDKTGTLTLGRPRVTEILAFNGLKETEVLRLAAVGWLPPIWAAAAQSLPDVAILLNSSRLLKR